MSADHSLVIDPMSADHSLVIDPMSADHSLVIDPIPAGHLSRPLPGSFQRFHAERGLLSLFGSREFRDNLVKESFRFVFHFQFLKTNTDLVRGIGIHFPS